jgi:hypothetical protein
MLINILSHLKLYPKVNEKLLDGNTIIYIQGDKETKKRITKKQIDELPTHF